MLGLDIAAALPELRAQAESLMVDACTITVPGEGDGTLDEDTGQVTPPSPVTIYGPSVEPHLGKCQVQTRDVQPANPTVGDTEYTTLAYVVKIPIAAPAVPAGASIEIVTSLLDPRLAGAEFTVTSPVHKTYLTARRLVCEEVT